MPSVKTADAQRALGAIVRQQVQAAAGPDGKLSKTDQKKLEGFTAEVAAELRAKNPGKTLKVNDVVDAAMGNAMRGWNEFNPQNGSRDAATLSQAEVNAVAKKNPNLGKVTRAAIEIAQKSSTGTVPKVSIESTVPGFSVSRNGDKFTLKADASVPVNTSATLVVDGMRFDVVRRAAGFSINALTENVPEGYGVLGFPPSSSAAGIETVVQIAKDPPGGVDKKAALAKAREGLATYIQNERMNDADWGDYFPKTWPELVARGVPAHLENFGNADVQDVSVISQPDRFIFTGRSAFDLYTEVDVRKSDGKILRAYIEID